MKIIARAGRRVIKLIIQVATVIIAMPIIMAILAGIGFAVNQLLHLLFGNYVIIGSVFSSSFSAYAGLGFIIIVIAVVFFIIGAAVVLFKIN